MLRFTKTLAALTVFALVTFAAPAHAAKWALLVGVNEYENPDITSLHYAVSDVGAVADDLTARVGFPADNVLLMTSDMQGNSRPTNVNVLKRLDLLSRRVKPGDTFLFYFSGHGFIRGAGQHFLGTVNADPQTIDTLQLTSLPMALLRDQMSKIHASSVIFIIDACRNDPESGKGGGNNLMTPDFKKDLKVVVASSNGGQAGTALLFACGEHERSYEEPEWKHGVFTHYLLEGLETGKAADPRGELPTMSSLAQYVQTKVSAWSDDNDKQQHPDLEQQGAAQIVLADRFATVAPPVVIPPVTRSLVVPVKPAPAEPDFIDTDVPPPPSASSELLSPIMPDTPAKDFEAAISELLAGATSKFESYKGLTGTSVEDHAGTWTEYSYKHGVPGFKPGMVWIHALNDGNYYDAGNYVEFEYAKTWASADVEDATTTLRKLTGEVLTATGRGWTAKPSRSNDDNNTAIVCSQGEYVPDTVTLKLVRDRKSTYHLFLDVSDGMH